MTAQTLHLLMVIHFLALSGLALYGIHRIWMIGCWWHVRESGEQAPVWPEKEWPTVTVQIPLYNEASVAARIIDAAASFEWAAEKLDIQVLDDSTDITCRIVDDRVAYWASRGVAICVIRRDRRTGYKAGALAHGLKQAKGELIAIFDADFVPCPDYLFQTVSYFSGPDIGMVQTRWGFFNAGFSWLTRLQAMLLSTHFDIEHEVRYRKGLFFNFNGTAGIWRKTAIESAGGWASDTVTEDLDLSYRAQMAGWRFVYASRVEVLSELPVTLSDFRRQQDRWGKGAIQTARKLLPKIMASSLPIPVKIEAVAHLMANVCWVFGFIATLTLYPMLLNRIGIGVYHILWLDLPLFLLAGVAVMAYYMIYELRSGRKGMLWVLPLLPAASIGLAPFFSLTVVKGLVQKGGVFERTPKFGITDSRPATFHFTFQSQVVIHLLMNIPLLIYTLVPVLFAWHRGTWPAIPFLCFFPLGFFIVMANDAFELLKMSRK